MAQFNFVQYKGATGTATTTTGTITMGSVSTAGDLLVLISYWGTSVISSIKDSSTNTWNALTENNPMTVWYAAGIAAGTTTITYTSVASGGAFNSVTAVAEYTLGSNYIIIPNQPTVTGDLIGTDTTIVDLFVAVTPQAPYGTVTEALGIIMGVNTNTGSVWTQSTGSIRGTSGTGAAWVTIGDLDSTTSGPGNIFGTITSTQTNAGSRVYCFFNVFGYSYTPPIFNVNVVEWLGTAVTSSSGIPIVVATGTVTASIIGTPNVNVSSFGGTAISMDGNGLPYVDSQYFNGEVVQIVGGVPEVWPIGGVVNTASTVLGTPAVNVTKWAGTGVSAVTGGIPDVNVKNWGNVIAQVDGNNLPIVDVGDWLGTAVVSDAGVPVTTNTGTVTATVPGGGSTNVNVVEWLGTAVTSNAGVPVVYTTNTVTSVVASGTVTTVSGNVVGSVGSVVGTVTATVPTLSTNVNVQEWLGTAVTSNAGIPVVYTTNTVTATVVGTVTLGTGQLTVKKDQGLNGFTFPMYNSTTGALQTGLTVTAVVSKDGGSTGSTTNSPSEVGSGLYSLDLAAADTDGTVLTFIFSASGAAASVITVVTQA